MSSILKALKKVEHEKTARFANSLKIDTDILQTVDSPRGVSSYSLALLFLLVFAGGGAVAFYFIKDTKAPQETGAPSLTVTDATTLKVKNPYPEIRPETLPAEIIVVPAGSGTSGKTSRNKNYKPSSSDKAARAIEKIPAKASAVSSISGKKKTEGAASAAAIVPALRVNGIAFQNSGAVSMAIVNGIPVSSGTVIEGTTVEEIQKDRVLFQRNGEKFEILLGQSNR